MGDAKPDITARALELLAKVPEDDVTWDSEAANEGLEAPSSDYIDGVNDALDTYARPMSAVLRELVAEVERLREAPVRVGDVVKVTRCPHRPETEGLRGAVLEIDLDDEELPFCVDVDGIGFRWCAAVSKGTP